MKRMMTVVREYIYISGRATAAGIGGEEAETLPRAAERGGGGGGATAQREGSGSGNGHAQERGVGSTRGQAERGGPSVAGQGQGPRGDGSLPPGPTAADNNVPWRRRTRRRGRIVCC